MTRLGIIGGGQLARMLALAAAPLGIDCVVVEPAPDPPAARVANVIQAAFDDPSALAQLADCDVVTVELEGVPVVALEWLAARVPVRPGPEAVAVAQDRLAEKRRCRSLGLATAPFDAEVTSFPRLVKTRFGGFDGRGQRWVHDHAELAEALAELPDPIVEGPVVFRRELALTVARGLDGAMRAFPLAETEHRHGILWRATAPARVTAEQVTEATAIGEALAESLDYVGVLAVELFDTADGLVVNELAPRVHNSGHWTIDGAVTSQFEQHVRAVCGLPLGDPSAIGVSVMVNAVGGEPTDAVLAIDGVHVHRYGKQSRPGRKVGHVTVNAPSLAGAEATAARVAELVPFQI